MIAPAHVEIGVSDQRGSRLDVSVPVQDDGQRRRGGFLWFEHEKTLAIRSDRVLVHNRIHPQASIEEFAWWTTIERGSCGDIHSHHFSIGAQVVEFFSISSPSRLATATSGYLASLVQCRE